MNWWVLPFYFLFPPCFWWSGSLALVEAVLAPLLDWHDSHGPRLIPSRSSTNIIRWAMSLLSILVPQPKKQKQVNWAFFWSPSFLIPLKMTLIPRPWLRGPQLTFVLYYIFSVCFRWWSTEGAEKAAGSTGQVWFNMIFVGPESDHWQCLSLTDSLTHWLTPV